MTCKGHVGSLWQHSIPPVTPPISKSLVPVTSAHSWLTFCGQNTTSFLVLVFPFFRKLLFSGASLKRPNSNFLFVCTDCHRNKICRLKSKITCSSPAGAGA